MTRKQLHSFGGLAACFSKFIPRYSELISPLTELLSPCKPYAWSETAEKSFETIKTKMASGLIIGVTYFNKQFYVIINCFDVAVGICLAQKDESSGSTHLI